MAGVLVADVAKIVRGGWLGEDIIFRGFKVCALLLFLAFHYFPQSIIDKTSHKLQELYGYVLLLNVYTFHAHC